MERWPAMSQHVLKIQEVHEDPMAVSVQEEVRANGSMDGSILCTVYTVHTVHVLYVQYM